VKSGNAGDVYGRCHTPETSLNRVDVRNVTAGWCLAQGEKGWGNLLQFASKEENMVVNDDLDKRCNGEQHSFAGLSW